MSDKLRPCPFCGKPVKLSYWQGTVRSYVIRCRECLLEMGECYDKVKLIEYWNTRKEGEDEK